MEQKIKIEAVVNIPDDCVLLRKSELKRFEEQLLLLQKNQLQQQRGLITQQNNTTATTNNTVSKVKAELLDVGDVAKRLKCNRNKVYELIKSGQLMGLKLGRIKVSTIELEDFLIRSAGKDLSNPYNVKDL